MHFLIVWDEDNRHNVQLFKKSECTQEILMNDWRNLMYKFSFYNIVIPTDNDSKYVTIFNTAYESIIKLEKDIYKLIKTKEFDSNIPYFSDLVNQGIIVPVDTNEYEKIIFEEKVEQLKLNSKFTIVIAPTLKCNFRCTYCFEGGMLNTKIMSRETMDALIMYIRTVIANRNSLKKIHIQWFGGEPLLGFEQVIIPLSIEIQRLCSINNIIYESSIITNGYYLSKNVFQRLIEDCKVIKFQITFDGTQENYCSRKQVSHEVYEKVKDNVFSLSKYIKENNLKISIHIRLNVDKANINDAYHFVNEMKSDKRFISNVFFYLGKLRFIDDASNQFFNAQEFCEENLKFNATFEYKNRLKLSRRIWCTQYTVNAIDIGPDGELYKCEHFFGQNDKIVGNVKDGIIYNSTYLNYMNQVHTEKCKECKIFPICIGGCPADRYKTKSENCEYSEEYCIELAKKYLELKAK